MPFQDFLQHPATRHLDRRFRITDQINRDGIDAIYRDGVLSLTLPKAEQAKAKKISIKAG